MKKFDELTEEQQKAAEEKALESLLTAVVESGLRFSDQLNGDDLQARIDAAMQRADDRQTPWFAASYIMDDATVAEALRGMARCDAEDAIYTEPGERCISGVL